MNKLTRSQREKVGQFVSIAGASEKAAIAALKASDWSVEAAFEFFYSHPGSGAGGGVDGGGRGRHLPQAATNDALIHSLYLRYKDPYQEMIYADGISLLCEDLQVDPNDIALLVLSWHMKAATMCEYSRQEFVSGLKFLGVDSIEKLRQLLPALRTELKDDHKFREMYGFAFDWAKEKGQKSLALDTAVGMWMLLLAERPWPLVEPWCRFLQARHNKAISRDTWAQLLEFSWNIDPSLTNYDEEGAWPYLLDEFVDYLREAGIAPPKVPMAPVTAAR